jgi:hypothetical protein
MLHHHFGIEDKVIRGFDAIAIKIAHSKKIKLALYNAASSCVYTCYLATNANTSKFDEWLFHVFNTEAYRYPTNLSVLHNTPGSSTKGFSVHLQNRNHRNEEKISIISLAIPDNPSNNYPPIEHAFNYDQFLGDGKHGYHQELGITVTLERFFKRGTELFVSPKYIDGLEFSDYLLLNKNAVIVIESKYVISSKSTKRHQAIKKAIHQLNRAEQSILAGEAGLEDKVIKSALKGTTVVLKVCLLNSAIQLNDDNAKNIADSFSKCELPIFISVAGFFNLLTGLGLKNAPIVSDNLFFNLIRLYQSYQASEEAICYYDKFSIEGLSEDELNDIGEKYRQDNRGTK